MLDFLQKIVFPMAPGERSEEDKKEIGRILRNTLLISFCFLLLFTAYSSMASLQSSINSEDGLGTWSLTATYAALVVSCLFLPAPTIAWLTTKWAMAISMLTYSAYIAAQFYPTFATLIPAAVVLGLGAGPMWSAQCSYLTKVGYRIAELTGVEAHLAINRFFGVFFLMFQLSGMVGNIISATVLQSGEDETESTTAIPGQTTEETLSIAFCGPNYDPDYNDLLESSAGLEDDSEIYTLAGIYLGFSLLSVVGIALFLDPLSRFCPEGEQGPRSEGKAAWLQLALATFQHIRKHKYQILLIPITFWSGVEQGFFTADFTAAYITCPFGVDRVGFVLATYYGVDSLFSYFWGAVVRALGRPLVFALGTVFNVAAVTSMFMWNPTGDDEWVLYVLAALWGIADAVWQTQINALYGALFGDAEEAAFSNYRLWESCGFIFAFILQNTVNIKVKLSCVVGSLAFGMLGYAGVEILERRKNKETRNP